MNLLQELQLFEAKWVSSTITDAEPGEITLVSKEYNPHETDYETRPYTKKPLLKAPQVGLVVTAKNTKGMAVQIIGRFQYIANASPYTKPLPELKKIVEKVLSASGTPLGNVFKPFHSNKIWLIFKPGVSEDDAKKATQATLEKFTAAAEKEYAANVKHKAEAPARRRETSKASAARYKISRQALYDKYGKNNVQSVTARQISGDDGYQWNVLVNNRSKWNGLTLPEVDYYKRLEYEDLLKKNGKQ